MKIGILTFWWSNDNYGQLLQCYALQKYLRDMGHEAFLIRYKKSSDVKKSSSLFRIFKIFNPIKLTRFLTNKKRKSLLLAEQRKNDRHFDNFREKYIVQSEVYYSSYTELCENPPEADVYIAGSDQIWNFTGISVKESKNALHAMFLDFGNAKKFSYAASWVMTSLPQEYIEGISPLLSKFDYISVREKKGIQLCASCGRNDAEVVADPTLLLDAEIYRRLYKENPHRTVATPFILLYMLNNEYDFDIQTVYDFAARKNLELVYVTGNGMLDKRTKFYAMIPEWLYLIDNSEYIVTNSFHCSVFSLLFGKRFGVVPLTGSCNGMNTRFETLFSDYGILPRYVQNSDFSVLDFPCQPISKKEPENFLCALENVQKTPAKDDKKIRICFITERHINPLVGGTERITFSVANSLKTHFKNYEFFSIFTVSDDNPAIFFDGEKKCDNPLQMAEFLKEQKIDIIVVQGYFWLVLPLRKNLQKLNFETEIVFAHHFAPGWEYNHLFHGLCDRLLTKKYTFKTFVKLAFYPILNFRQLFLGKKAYKNAYKYSDKMVLLSKNFILPFKKFAHISDSKKFAVIPNMLSYSDYLQEQEFSQKENIVLIVSRMSNTQKRIILALKIWRLVKKSEIAKNWKLVLLGDGIDRKFLESFAATRKIKDVYFKGRKEPKEFYKKASLFMMTSKSEGWGLTLTEAQQFGCVSIAFNTYASLKDIISDGENGFAIPEGDLNLYAEKMLLLMSDKNLRIKMAEKGIASAKRFEANLVAEKWNTLFSILINREGV